MPNCGCHVIASNLWALGVVLVIWDQEADYIRSSFCAHFFLILVVKVYDYFFHLAA